MHHPKLAVESQKLPLPADDRAAETGLAHWREAAQRDDCTEIASKMADFAADSDGQRILAAIFGNSPYLTATILRDPGFALELFTNGPDAARDRVLEALRSPEAESGGEAEIMAELRRTKSRAALTVAVADLAEIWPLDRVTGALSELAEAALDRALVHLLRQAHDQGQIELADPADPLRNCGYTVLGMGKLGSRELNYSSDIDLIILFDPELLPYRGSKTVSEFAQRLSRDLVRMMEERTRDGYVFRMDLRLRPDPRSTPVALNIDAAQTYYESMGQNWERAAMIKARPVAGDRSLGQSFLSMLRPFIWRKYLDFAAIQDIHSIKRQIAKHRGNTAIAFAGHNIKLGRGGIREIEFFAQTQQLIWGGRDPDLRVADTIGALAALSLTGHVEAQVSGELADAYTLLRRIEHRLQMIDDQQTQTLPENGEKLAALGVFLNYQTETDFAKAVSGTLETVARHYDDLFAESPSLGGTGNLVFTGGDPDPDTVETLHDMGFAEPAKVWEIVRGWHHGGMRATRSDRARQLLTELMPELLTALSRTANPDTAFVRFAEFLNALPAGVQLFSLFHSNPQLLTLVAEIMGTAPRLASRLSRYPILLDAVLDEDLLENPLDKEALQASLEEALGPAAALEDILNLTRRWTNDRHFLIGTGILRQQIGIRQATSLLSDIAEVVIGTLLPRVLDDFATNHGHVPGGSIAVIGFGKLGGRELTLGSDLDLVFVYDVEDPETESDGPRPLAAGTYFARLAQRLINALTALTGEGGLFEVDMRLRPSGNAGPIATRWEAFERYYAESAWTWEEMALTKARPIAGSRELNQRLQKTIVDILTRQRAPDKLTGDVLDMRARIAKEHPGHDAWDIKYMPGGLIDIEFLCQYLQLRHGHDRPAILAPGTATVLKNLHDAGCLDDAAHACLSEAFQTWLEVQGLLRLCVEGRFEEGKAPDGLRRTLARVTGRTDFGALRADITALAEKTRRCFEDIVGIPEKTV